MLANSVAGKILRYMLKTEIVERMDNGDINLIKEIAELFKQENTQEGTEKVKVLLQLY